MQPAAGVEGAIRGNYGAKCRLPFLGRLISLRLPTRRRLSPANISENFRNLVQFYRKRPEVCRRPEVAG